MEKNSKIKIALLIASFAAMSVVLAAHHRRRRKERRNRTRCYLHSEKKPQHSFKRLFADNSFSPFKPSNLSEGGSSKHPYESEISSLMENSSFEFEFNTDGIDLVMSEEYVWVETEAQLRELASVLSEERVFGVDTEQHSLRSFLGFTCLIQISTKKKDYLVDTIALHDVMGILQPVFADPSICKVFHGADNDVLWLQRDFRIYVVNLFDTAKACELLSKPQKSLAYLLQTYCDVASNKLLQREDWRLRPLSVEMVEYARADAHYLVFIASCLIDELKQHDTEKSSCPDDKFNFVLEASRRSNMICMQLYTKEIEAPPGASAASSILSRHANGQGGISTVSCQSQFEDLVRRLCAWRDVMARLHDESSRYVLSDQAIVALAAKVPKATSEICGVISEADLNVDSSGSSFLSSPSPIVCSHLDDFLQLWQDKIHNLDDILPFIVQKHLSGSKSCPLSVFNYALLVNCNQKITNKVVPKQNGFRHSKQASKKSSREMFVQKFSCKSPVYHNCRIYADDGRLLCYCDKRKLEWYLRRDLAKLVDEDPPAIMLLFEPKGRPEDEDNDFYLQSKKNICVGCGEKNHYLRYRVIPSCYRVHFPEHLKSHRSHDIVLLCVDCHEIAHVAAEKYKKQIAKEFGIPLFIRKVVDSGQPQVISEASDSAKKVEEAGVSPLQLRIAAMALLRHGPRMPSERREELTKTVMRYYGGREVTEEDLEKALLVGMSPHERRRLEKKKGLSLKHSTGSESEHGIISGSTAGTAIAVMSEVESLDDSHGPSVHVPFGTTEDRDSCAVIGNGMNGPSSSDSGTTTVQENGKSDKSSSSDTKEDTCNGDGDDNYEDKSQPNGSVDLPYRYDGDVPPKHNSKLSLLGHGPHGKLVVDHLLKEYGDDGVSQFCQRWRQVFVEAVNPRFLPAGWDVLHSGRRDFGEFSIFNPSKKVEAESVEAANHEAEL